jgi:hypothetical protein
VGGLAAWLLRRRQGLIKGSGAIEMGAMGGEKYFVPDSKPVTPSTATSSEGARQAGTSMTEDSGAVGSSATTRSRAVGSNASTRSTEGAGRAVGSDASTKRNGAQLNKHTAGKLVAAPSPANLGDA